MFLSREEKAVIAALRSLGKPSSMRSVYEEVSRLGARMKMEEIELAVWRAKIRGIVADGPRKGQIHLDAFWDEIAGDKVDHHDHEGATTKG